MAGHSKWANIKHRKQKQDKKKAKLFSKLSKRIAVAAREGGGDPDKNADLSMAIEKARDNNMPNENIERAIKRGTGELEGVEYEEFVYEGYGPGGVALYLDIMSDNRNRTASEIRHLLSDSGGNLGEEGCVAWMFDQKGQIIIDLTENKGKDEEELMLEAIETGAEDVQIEDQVVTIYTAPEDLIKVRETLENDGYEVSSGDLAMIPNNEVKLDKSTAKKTLRLMNKLEDHDDVQEVYANFDIPDEVMEEIEQQE
ncbi:MAG: YebC/PmpR family DNA-binding transcriptional regulator [Halanaerobiales bacterium]